MSSDRPPTFLCIASYQKGEDFIRACKEEGARVLFLTAEKLRGEAWPWESIDEVFYMPDMYNREDVIKGVSYLARAEKIDRIIPLDEFDLETAAALREHLRVPGMGETTVRYFRDKLAMRFKAREEGILVPDFAPVVNYDELRDFMSRQPAPWILKPRSEASAIGIKKIHEPEELWRTLDELGDKQSTFLIEQFVPGDVYHVDAVISGSEVRFAEAHRYASTPFEVMHSGGIFASRTLDREGEEAQTVIEINRQLIAALGLVRGAVHTEFIRSREDGRYYFLETAARVGGANIVEMVEAATGLNLWREWARLEVADARGIDYQVPVHRKDYAGVIISLARQEWPDMSGYDDPEIVWRIDKKSHAGLIVRAEDPARVEYLLDGYSARFYQDFYASMPAPDEATS
ncbi:ATPase [soil metagenome]